MANIAPNQLLDINKPKLFPCLSCTKAYSHLKNLRVHVKRAHPAELNEIAPLPPRKYNCNFCDKTYNTKSYLSLHERRAHGAFDVNGKKAYNCPMCAFTDSYKKKLFTHFENDHNIRLETEEHAFSSRQEFNTWKENIECETKSKFVHKRGSQSKRSTHLYYYECHRSGTYISKGSGVRRLKRQGSKKIGGTCPAMIILTITCDSIKVTFMKTHVGHTNDLNHLSLTNSEQNMLAEKIALDVPFDCILDEARKFVTEKGELSKLDTLKKYDLHNIKQKFNLCTNIDEGDSLKMETIDICVLELDKNNSCILLYKPSTSTIEELPMLKPDDFVLVIMSEAQKRMLRLHGSIICIDRSYTLGLYNLEVITLLVLDELNQGFPCSFFLTSRCDEEILKIFFELIKDNFGSLLPTIFMSDVADMFYNAFTAVMGSPEKRLFCSWHVNNAWSNNLKIINQSEKRIEIYETLRKLLQEHSESAFNCLLSETMNKMLLDSDTMEFGAYFIEMFSRNVKLWGGCYTTVFDTSTNMHLELLHKTIRRICFQDKQMNNLDKMLNMFMDFIQARFDNGLDSSYQQKVSGKARCIAETHQLSLICENIIIKRVSSGWDVHSESCNDMYFIQENSRNCDNCDLVCVKCEVCIHKYCCNCSDSRLNLNMCVHIHLLCHHISNDLPSANILQTTITNNTLLNNYSVQNEYVASNNLNTVYVSLSNENSACIDYQQLNENVQSLKELDIFEQIDYTSDISDLPRTILELNIECSNLLKTISTRAEIVIAKKHLNALKTDIDHLDLL